MGLAFNRVHQGDARLLAQRLPDHSLAVTLTSPPYWGLKDYGVPHQIGWEQDYQDYLGDLVGIFRHVYRATRATGSLWVVLDTLRSNGRLKLLPFEFADCLEREAGWVPQDVIIWDKGKTLPWSHTGRMRNRFEYILCFSKGKSFKYEISRLKEVDLKEWWVKYPERYNPKGKVPPNIWNLPIPVQGSWSPNGLRHACPFPVSLVERILLLTTDAREGQIVFDPFAGSGIVPALAEAMGRGFLGFELNPKFIEMYRTLVRSLVRRQWALRSAELDTLEGKRKALADQILRLRLTKYPKEVIKQVCKSLRASDALFGGALAVSPGKAQERLGNTKKHHLVSLRVILLLRNVENRPRVERAVRRIMSRPPLSKFGIDAQVLVLPLAHVAHLRPGFGLKPTDVLWVYTKGRTHKYRRQTSLVRWLQGLESRGGDGNAGASFPVIASNVRVSQKLQRTWSQGHKHAHGDGLVTD